MKRKLALFFTLFFVGIGILMAQTQVRGTVVDEAGDPVIGATIQIKGTTQGTVTDMDGSFSLSAPTGGTLVISYVGMQTLEVPVRANINVTLESDAEVLDELVVTAMGLTRQKKSIGYASQEVKADELIKARQTDLNNALVGKVSGLRFVGGSGSKFDAGKIYLRGTTSLTSATGNEPIYVVDGVITNQNSINMDDVESINVLKGPAATSLYGSRGGNGAIIITTKSIAEGRSEVNFSHTLAWEKAYSHVDVQKEYGGGYLGASTELPTFKWTATMPEYLKQFDGRKIYDYADDSSWGPKYTGEPYMPWYAWDPTDPRFGQQAPWDYQMDIKDLYRTGVTNTTNISFAKAGKDYNTRISFTNVDRNGVLYNSDAVRRFLTVKSSFNVTERLKVSLDYKYTYRKNHNAAVEGYGEFGNFLSSYLQWGNTNVNLKDLKNNYTRPDGTFRTWNIKSPTNLAPAFHENPYALMNEVNWTSLYQWNVFSGNVEYTILKNLKAGVNVNGNLRNVVEETKIPMNFNEVSKYSQNQNSLIDMQTQGYVSFSDRFVDDRLSLDATAFVEERDYSYKENDAFTRDGLFLNKFWNVSASTGLPGGSSKITHHKTQSIFATATVGLDDTYYLDANMRNDWTSTLHPDHNSYLYGGLSASVIMSNLVKTDWLNFWKLRASAAQVGSTMDPYLVYPVYVTNDGLNTKKYGGLTVMRQNTNLRDPNIKPTISTSYEVGTEFRVFENRFWGDFNFYNRDSKNQIIDQNVTPASGYSTMKINAGLIRNRGIELTLGGMPVKTRDLQWTVNFNYSKNNNTLVELIDNDKDDDSYQVWWTKFYYPISINAREGQPIGLIQGNDWLRDKNGNLILEKLDAGDPDGDVYPIVDSENQTKDLGVAQPDFTGGFSTSLNYKGFMLSAALDFSFGGEIVSWTNLWGNSSGILKKTAGLNDRGKPLRDPVSEGGGVHLTGVDADGKPLDGYIDAQVYYQDIYPQVWAPSVYDASYVKLREISIGYELPKTFLNKTKLGLNAASISFVAQNPWLIYSGTPNIDPSETSGADYDYVEGGQSISTRSYGVTINLTF
ncbi:SusC/RagA family TonB-linked outer membrane protein [Proteiniphilum sp. UBA5384]|uniref:SusC/RagA family TonB-linked outer membrane protein n=1 Tax=Proteiniphilum sp. UBA5384 TaxID=1947279 RepID=UPI0025D761E6|nr:SusC/RagA family TonB-linked outer membrane protein [Proteiniphilum sp. UBA5384]